MTRSGVSLRARAVLLAEAASQQGADSEAIDVAFDALEDQLAVDFERALAEGLTPLGAFSMQADHVIVTMAHELAVFELSAVDHSAVRAYRRRLEIQIGVARALAEAIRS